MTVKQITSLPTEADLEAEIRAAIKLIFPLLPQASIRHQIQFQFKFGHAVINIDGSKPTYSAKARADVILYFGQNPLAVLELKRESELLSDDDGQQGLSYARALKPSPPLVVVTNGKETRYLETHTGTPWVVEDKDELAFTALMDSATKAARSDLKIAVQTLMGTNPSFWVQVVRQASQSNMEELLGAIEDTDKPFGRNFLIPRRATLEVLSLMENQKLILLEGSSLVGKSNVLREINLQTVAADTGATLYIETETGSSILQSIADALEDHLNWPVTPEEARFWLKQVSDSDGPDLILAIDGLNSDSREVRKEIEDLSSTKFGVHLKLVVALDPSVAKRIVSTKGRNLSPIGHRSARVEVGLLDDREFNCAVLALLNNRLALLKGATYTPEYRFPWVLRNLAAASLPGLEGEHENINLALLPMLSTDLIQHARDRFSNQPLRRSFAKLAQAMIDEVKDTSRHSALVSECHLTYAIRRTTLLQSFSSQELDTLCEEGYLKEAIHQTAEEEICYVRQPALLASELARVLKKEILARGNDEPEDTALWLTDAASSLPLGEIIAAHAIREAAGGEEGIPLGVISTLLTTKPHTKPLAQGMVLAGSFPNLGYVKFKIVGDKTIEVLSNGKLHRLELEEHLGHMYVDCTPWHILSNVFGSQSEIQTEGGELGGLQGAILLQIASSELPLHPTNFLHRQLPMHDLLDGSSIICHSVGMVEQITQSLFTYLQLDLSQSESWVEQAMKRNSSPLLARLHIALREMCRLSDPDLSAWANDTLSNQVLPALLAKLPDQESHLAEPA